MIKSGLNATCIGDLRTSGAVLTTMPTFLLVPLLNRVPKVI
jgi:hypothetical protein